MPIDLRPALDALNRGDLDGAARESGRALAEDPDRADALHLLGLVALRRGELARASTLIGRAVAVRPEVGAYRGSLAEVYHASGRLDLAAEAGRAAVRLRPDDPGPWCNLGSTLVDLGRFDEAVACFREALRLRPGLVEAHNNLGHALQAVGDPASAVGHFEAAVRLDPDSAVARNNLGKALLDRGDLDLALEQSREAVRLAPDYFEGWVNLARAFQTLGKPAEAEASVRQALRVRPDSAPALATLGAIQEQLGDLDGSLATFRRALDRDPRHAGTLARLATRLRDRLPEADRDAIEALLADPDLPAASRTSLLFGLAHVLDALGDFGRAASLAGGANALQRADFERRGLGYDPEAHAKLVDDLIAGFSPGFFERARGWGLPSDRPIFVVGMPRSGTSLVEQILASHPQVFGAGELRLARSTFDAMAEGFGRPATLRECLDRLDAERAGRLARRHLDGLSALDASAGRVVDKMPENTLFLGLIAAILPASTIIHCRRDPRDVALSCWLTDFGQVRWACDPGHIASRIGESGRLMDHWRSVLPTSILDVDYEAIVDDLEGQARRLVAASGLDWDPACLDFHRTRRTVQTASVAQVRRPIYRGSVGRWKNYERASAGLFAGLTTGS